MDEKAHLPNLAPYNEETVLLVRTWLHRQEIRNPSRIVGSVKTDQKLDPTSEGSAVDTRTRARKLEGGHPDTIQRHTCTQVPLAGNLPKPTVRTRAPELQLKRRPQELRMWLTRRPAHFHNFPSIEHTKYMPPTSSLLQCAKRVRT